MKIEFYIPNDEFIPSTLRLKVDDVIDVYYEKLKTDFGWFHSPMTTVHNGEKSVSGKSLRATTN